MSFGAKALEGSFLNHKRNKRKNKRHKKGGWVLGAGCWVLGTGYWVLGIGIQDALARSEPKAPKFKKLSFAGEKERQKKAPF